ncbi:hypothetical protein ACFL2J_02910 [Candidatus Omnitrophota bacterium]
MNHDENIIPEEKLLNLIRHPGKNSHNQKPAVQAKASPDKKTPEPVAVSTASQRPSLKQAKFVFPELKSLNFTLINRLIIIVAFIAFLLLLSDLYFHSPQASKQSVLPEPVQKIAALKDKEAKPFSYYQEEIASRELFTPSPVESRVKKVVPEGPTFRELIKDLKLLGVVSGDKQQVIIEDEKLRKTYFLYIGDTLGEVRVEEVDSNRVVLELDGERISLFL